MKRIYSLLFVLSTVFGFSQSPAPYINYQGVARGPGGNPIIGTIGIKLDIHQGSGGGTVVFSEPHTVSTNMFGIFNLQIGSQNTSGFAAIDWSLGPYHLEVSMDPNGGSSYTSISNQQLVSVPYALYAEKAKNATTTSITASSNMTVTNLGVNNFSLSVPYYVAGSNVTITPTAGNIYQINAGPSNTTASLGTWTNNLNNVYLVNNQNNVGIGTINPTAKLDVNTGTATTLDAIYGTTGLGNGVLGSSASTASNIAGVKGINSNVGPGVFGSNSANGTGVYGENMSGSAANTFGVNGKTNSQGTNAAGVLGENYGMGPGVYGFQGNTSGGANSNGVMGVSNSLIGAGVQGINNGGNAGVAGIISMGGSSASSNGVYGITNSGSNLANGVYGNNSGAGSGVYGATSSSVNTSRGVFGKNNGAGDGVFGETSSTLSLSSGVHGNNLALNGGNGVMGTANSSVAAGVYGDNSGAGDGVYGRTSSSNSFVTTAGVHGNHYGAGYGVYGIATSPNVVYAGVYGLNNGAGSGVLGNTGSGDVNAAGVYGLNNGTGPGVKASVPTGTVAGGLNLSLLLENGHIRSVQPNQPVASTFSNTGGISGATYTLQGCTDVKGNLLAVATTTGMINIGGQLTVKVNFVKPYTVLPTVVVCPTSDLGLMSFFVSAVTPTSFNVTFKNNTAGNITGGPFNFNFNYIVIE